MLASRLLSQDSPSGEMKAVVRECSIKGEGKQFLEVSHCECITDSAAERVVFILPSTVVISDVPLLPVYIDIFIFIFCLQYNFVIFFYLYYIYWVFQIWHKNRKTKSLNLTALKKHGKVYEDGKSSKSFLDL